MWRVFGALALSFVLFSVPSISSASCLRLVGDLADQDDDSDVLRLQTLLQMRELSVAPLPVHAIDREILEIRKRLPTKAEPLLDAYSAQYRDKLRRVAHEMERVQLFVDTYRQKNVEPPEILFEKLEAAERRQDELLSRWRYFQISTFVDPGW